ncbi:hypothetical protein Hdeb2414_s0003g00111921 [Helianthus debilis subsp. tardiflorus]
MQTSHFNSKSKLSKHPFQDSQYPHHKPSPDHPTGSGSLTPHIKKVFLEGYVHEEEELVRAKSLTDEDLEELKGCLDLGFGFNYDEIPELCNTLPALELCYSMSRKFLDEQQKSPESSSAVSVGVSSMGGKASWKISSPGDDPEDVKARLKFWAQAVACTVKLCS